MTTLDPTGAAARLLTYHTVTPAECLVYAGDVILQGRPVLKHATDANHAWANTVGKHSGTPPRDHPVYFSGGLHGDVAIASTPGFVVAIDTPQRGKVGTQTYAQRATQMGGHLLGWGSDFLGYQLVTPSSTPASVGLTTTVKAQIMAYGGVMIEDPTPGGRGVGIVGPGFYHHLANSEEVLEAQKLITQPVIIGNTREYDVWVAVSTQGTHA